MADSERPGPGRPVTVFLLDDHEVVRRGVHDLLADEPDIDVVGEAATAAQALARVPALRPRVAVLDVRLPDGDGVSVCRELRSRMPDLSCLMLTSFDDEEALLDSIMAGASGFVLKQISGFDLVSAVRTVAAGKSLLDPSATARLMARLRGERERPQEPEALPGLTAREREILVLIGEGLTNREIGRRLYLAEKTVKNHISRLLAKLGVERRIQAAVLATQEHDRREHDRQRHDPREHDTHDRHGRHDTHDQDGVGRPDRQDTAPQPGRGRGGRHERDGRDGRRTDRDEHA